MFPGRILEWIGSCRRQWRALGGGWLRFLLETDTTVPAPKHLDSGSGAGAYYATLAKSPFPLPAPVFPSLGSGPWMDGFLHSFQL